MNMTENRSVERADNPKAMLALLKQSESAIAMALPRHLTADRMMRLALTSFSSNPAIRECTPRSIIASVVVASQLGLEIGIAGQGYLIPYGKTCTFVPGWQGLVGLVNNTGRATVWTGSVFEGDKWEYTLGSQPHCTHVPGPNFGDPDKLIWVYACGKVNGSEQPVIEAWPITRVKKHRDKYNKVGQRHYSFQNFEMYARKVVVLQVLKYMPRSIELNNAIVASNAAEEGRPVTVEAGTIIEIDPAADDIQQEPAAAATAPAAKKVATPSPVGAPKPAAAATEAVSAPSQETTSETIPETMPESTQETEATAPEPAVTETQTEPPEDAGECVKMIETLARRDGVSNDQVLRFLYGSGVADAKKHKSLTDLATNKLQRIIVQWAGAIERIRKIAA